MARSKDVLAAKYDLVHDRIVRGEKIDDAIKAEFSGSMVALGTLRGAYRSLAREKGHAKTRPPRSPLDIEAFKARFETAVAEKDAKKTSDFAALIAQMGDRLREVASTHPPAWVRKTIASCGVSVSKDEFEEWLGGVIDVATKKQKTPKPPRAVEERPAPSSVMPGGSDATPGQEHEKDPPGNNASVPSQSVSSTKPPRPNVVGRQNR